jgi:HSP20 family protein
MLTRFHDFDNAYTMMDELRRRMDRIFGDVAGYASGGQPEQGGDWNLSAGGWPRTNVYDAGSNLLLEAEVPGLTQQDLQLTINQNLLTLTGERRLDVPEGYTVHRQERVPLRFSRSVTLPCKIDPEKSVASLDNGVLTVTLPKAPEAQPRKIAIG